MCTLEDSAEPSGRVPVWVTLHPAGIEGGDQGRRGRPPCLAFGYVDKSRQDTASEVAVTLPCRIKGKGQI